MELKGGVHMNDNHDLGQAIGFTATISFVFMMCYTFNLTKTPFFLLLISVMSFGYTLCLLGYYKKEKRRSLYTFMGIGLILITLCVALSFVTPHESSFFN